jgi:hypothetical protein
VCVSLSLLFAGTLTYRATSQTQNLSPQKHQTIKQNAHKPNKKKLKKLKATKWVSHQ